MCFCMRAPNSLSRRSNSGGASCGGRSASDLGSGIVRATRGAGPPSPGVARGRPMVQQYKLLEEGTKLVYKHLAKLYFVFAFDSSENELAMLDLVHVFVETLNRCFKNVCELDIVFNFNKLHTVLDEMILGGQVIETNSEEIMRSVEEIARLEKQSNTTSLIPKSISERFSR
ncbi:hypothetical protein QYE76_069557 [Lolium multiflorum]|uniref:AP complex mu/sigma subunit domain-containing protein n=1 Tax=Lolium multiflorum TaxID=4521 RepID=A0AAD8WF15_LOLMU|nr:hypothetical protein QYE76_069557 [Lolium multiflorum]